jgi:hypothetical protein
MDDFRHMPRLIAGFLLAPVVLLSAVGARLARILDAEAAM